MTEGSPAIGSSVDPKAQLQGVRLPNLLLELSNQIPGRTGKEMITYWRISDRYAEHCVDAILRIDKEMKVLKDAMAIVPQLQNRVDAEINRKIKERTDWSMSCLHSLARDGQPGRSLQAQIEVLQRKAKKDEATLRRIKQAERNLKVGNEVLQKKAQRDEATIRSLQRQCDETTNDNAILEEKVRTLESESRKKDMAIELSLSENLLAKGTRNQGEANNKSRNQWTNHPDSLSFLPTAVEISQSSKLEDDHSGTRLRSTNSMSLVPGEQNEDSNSSPNLENKMESETEPRERGDLVQSQTILQIPQGSSFNLEKRMEPETGPRDRGDLVQSETILQNPQDSSSKLEKGMEPETEPREREDLVRSETILQKPQDSSSSLEERMEHETEPPEKGDLVQSETIVQKPQDSSSNLEKRMKPETEPRDRGDLVQSEMILQMPQDSSSKLKERMEPETEPRDRGDIEKSETILQKPEDSSSNLEKRMERETEPPHRENHTQSGREQYGKQRWAKCVTECSETPGQQGNCLRAKRKKERRHEMRNALKLLK